MKILWITLLLLAPALAHAQTDSLASAVYPWNSEKPIVSGSTLDLSILKAYTVTLAAGKTWKAPAQEQALEKLVIVKSGAMHLQAGQAAQTIGPRSLALVIAGDSYNCKNTGKEPLIFYVLTYQTKIPGDVQRGRNAGGSLIKEWTTLPVTTSDKGAYRPLFDRPSSLFPKFDIHATQLNPGYASHPAHTHRVEEIILLIKGKVQMQTGNTFHDASAGDIVFLEANVPHASKNLSNEPAEYYAIQWHVTP